MIVMMKLELQLFLTSMNKPLDGLLRSWVPFRACVVVFVTPAIGI